MEQTYAYLIRVDRFNFFLICVGLKFLEENVALFLKNPTLKANVWVFRSILFPSFPTLHMFCYKSQAR